MMMNEIHISKSLRLSYIASRFFDKSGDWLTKKINGKMHNGKPDALSTEQKIEFKKALKTMAKELSEWADEL